MNEESYKMIPNELSKYKINNKVSSNAMYQ